MKNSHIPLFCICVTQHQSNVKCTVFIQSIPHHFHVCLSAVLEVRPCVIIVGEKCIQCPASR